VFNGLKLHLVFSPEGDKSLPVVSTGRDVAPSGLKRRRRSDELFNGKPQATVLFPLRKKGVSKTVQYSLLLRSKWRLSHSRERRRVY
jgi:hypothetical protein